MIRGRYLWEAIREVGQLAGAKGRLLRLASVLLFVFMVAGIVAVGSWCLRNAFADLMKNRAAESWPVVKGNIIEASVQATANPGGDLKDTYYPQLNVRFQVSGQWHSCREIYFGYGSTGDRGKVAEDVSTYAVGRETDVRYNPQDPSESLLRPGSHGTNVAFMAVGSVMLGLGLLLGIPLLFGSPRQD